jgi:hypothetical protein
MIFLPNVVSAVLSSLIDNGMLVMADCSFPLFPYYFSNFIGVLVTSYIFKFKSFEMSHFLWRSNPVKCSSGLKNIFVLPLVSVIPSGSKSIFHYCNKVLLLM